MITEEFIQWEAEQEQQAFIAKMESRIAKEKEYHDKAVKEVVKENPKALVTRESLKAMLENPNPAYVEAVIGRALVVLFKRQTESEQATNDTKENNGIGFAGCDAEGGSISAKYYLKTGHLKDFAIEAWLRPAKNGYPRLCKYAKQLNEAANQRKPA